MQEITFIVEKLEQLGMALTEKAAQGIEFLWPLAVRQVVVSAVGWLVLGLAAGVVALLTRRAKRWVDDDFDKLWIGFMTIAMGAVGVSMIVHNVGVLMNVKYHALNTLVGLIKRTL